MEYLTLRLLEKLISNEIGILITMQEVYQRNYNISPLLVCNRICSDQHLCNNTLLKRKGIDLDLSFTCILLANPPRDLYTPAIKQPLLDHQSPPLFHVSSLCRSCWLFYMHFVLTYLV